MIFGNTDSPRERTDELYSKLSEPLASYAFNDALSTPDARAFNALMKGGTFINEGSFTNNLDKLEGLNVGNLVSNYGGEHNEKVAAMVSATFSVLERAYKAAAEKYKDDPDMTRQIERNKTLQFTGFFSYALENGMDDLSKRYMALTSENEGLDTPLRVQPDPDSHWEKYAPSKELTPDDDAYWEKYGKPKGPSQDDPSYWDKYASSAQESEFKLKAHTPTQQPLNLNPGEVSSFLTKIEADLQSNSPASNPIFFDNADQTRNGFSSTLTADQQTMESFRQVAANHINLATQKPEEMSYLLAAVKSEAVFDLKQPASSIAMAIKDSEMNTELAGVRFSQDKLDTSGYHIKAMQFDQQNSNALGLREKGDGQLFMDLAEANQPKAIHWAHNNGYDSEAKVNGINWKQKFAGSDVVKRFESAIKMVIENSQRNFVGVANMFMDKKDENKPKFEHPKPL